MKMESIVLDIYPINKNSLILISFDELKFPDSIDFGSIKVVDSNNKSLLFELINKNDYISQFKYINDINKNYLSIIITRSGAKYIKILYKTAKKSSAYHIPKKTIDFLNNKHISIGTSSVSILFEKSGYAIEKIRIKGHEYGPLQLAASGGNLFFQKDMKDVKFNIISDSNIIKILKIEGLMKADGTKCKKNGFLPVEMIYYFWSADGKNITSKVEIELKYDGAVDLNGNKVEFLDPLIWYRLDNYTKNNYTKKNVFFLMSPYLALPNDGIHIEKGEDFFWACWHSMSEPKKPYWAEINKKEYIGKPQGYYPAHSLRGYWRICMYFGEQNENAEDIKSALSYQPKIRNIVHIGSEHVSNAYITRWKDNKKMAFNAITDDAKTNDYIYRAKGKIPKWVQIAIATRTLFGINYHRFCYIGNKIFYLPKQRLLSTILSTLFCTLGLGKSLRKEFEQENLSYILHTNTHPKIYKLDAERIINEIKKSENIWINKWKNKIPLSHVFSYVSPYGLHTEKGTMEKAAFSASKYLQWIREWPIPNAPLDFFLPTKLFWGICVGEIFDKANCIKIREEFIRRYKNGCDYMLISGHIPEHNIDCPKYVTMLFDFLEKHDDVWFAGADDIIKYYKARENTTIGIVRKQGKRFLIEISNNLSSYFSTEITLIQHINKKINKIQFSLDKKKFVDVRYKFIGKNIIMYNIPSNARYVVIS